MARLSGSVKSVAALGVVGAACFAGTLAGSALFSSSAVATASALRPEAASVGVVDLTKVMAGLTEAGEARTKLEESFKGLNADLRALAEEIKKISADLDVTKDRSTPDALRLRLRRAELEAQARARGEASQRVLDIQEGELLRRMFLKVTDAARRMAETQGYDLIIVDDRANVPPERVNDREALGREINDMVLSRRVLAASPKVDVTQALIDFMNNEFKAGGQ